MDTPMYMAIIEEVRFQIANEILKEGEQLPSIRNLAKTLKVSVITVKRAYKELEEAGYITTIPAKGSKVSLGAKERIKEEFLTTIRDHVTFAYRLAQKLKISDAEFGMLYELVKAEHNG
ncbi:MAG TPA: GntR family transcriptional regulator [Sphaerochaeta sp.]|nr:GntR family transcriptional regulator [Sphaerochaeta sp.]